MDWLELLGARFQAIGRSAVALAPNLLLAALLLVAVIIGARLIAAGAERFARRLGKRHNVALVVSRVVHGALLFIGVLLVITVLVPSFELGTMIQTLGLASVAIGLAFRDVLQNLVAGLLILWTEPYRVGDQIGYESLEGTVVEIRTRATHVSTYDGRLLILPNAAMYTHAVVINTAQDARRVEVDLRLELDVELERAKQVILSAMRQAAGVLTTPAPDVLVTGYDGAAIRLCARWWITPPRHQELLETRDAVLMRVTAGLRAAGIALHVPISRVVLEDPRRPLGDGDGRWTGARPAPEREGRG